MEKLHSQLPQPLKRCSPSRTAGDLLTQIKNSNSPLPNRSPARRTVTSSPNNIRSRDAAVVSLTGPKQPPEVKARSPEVLSRSRDSAATTPTRRSKYSPAAAVVNGNSTSSPVARSRIGRPQRGGPEAVVSDTAKQSPIKSIAARLPVRTKSAQLRTLRSAVDQSPSCGDCNDEMNRYEADETASLWTHQNSRPCGSAATVSAIKKSFSPKSDRRHVDVRKQLTENVDAEECNDEKNNGAGGGGSPIYHELDPPGTASHQFPVPVQHTYQSIVEISDELETLRGTARPEAATAEDQLSVVGRLSRARSAQELTPAAQKSPTRLSLFSRFRLATRKSSTKASAAKIDRGQAGVRSQRSLQDVDLITSSRDDVSVTSSSHDRQASFTTFAHRLQPASGDVTPCDGDGYSCVYVPRNNLSHHHHQQQHPDISAPVPPRTSSLTVDSNKPAAVCCEPLYRQKFLRIASVHTLQSAPPLAGDCPVTSSLTSSNSVGDLLLATDHAGRRQSSSQRVTSYDDHALATAGSRNPLAGSALRADSKSPQVVQRHGGALSPGRAGAAASFASPSCGVRMAAMRGAVRRCSGDEATSTSRSPSASTPVPSPRSGALSVFKFSVPPPGVMMSPPVHRAAYRHVSSQTVMSVRPPSASCILTLAAVHGPPGPATGGGLMQTIEEEDDDSTNDEGLQSTCLRTTSADRQPRPDDGQVERRDRQNSGTRTDDVGQSVDKVAAGGGRHAEDDVYGTTDDGDDVPRLRTQSDVTAAAVGSRTSKLRRPSPVIVASKPLPHGGSASPQPPDPHTASRIVPPTVSAVQRARAESSSVSPPSTPRSHDPQPRSVSAARAAGELVVRRPFNRGQQQRRQAAPPADCSDTTSTPGDGGHRKQSPMQRRLVVAQAATDASSSTTGSPNLSSAGSSLSLLSTGSEVEAGPSPPEPSSADTRASPASDSRSALHTSHHHSKYSAITSRVGKFNELTIPAHITDRGNY